MIYFFHHYELPAILQQAQIQQIIIETQQPTVNTEHNTSDRNNDNNDNGNSTYSSANQNINQSEPMNETNSNNAVDSNSSSNDTTNQLQSQNSDINNESFDLENYHLFINKRYKSVQNKNSIEIKIFLKDYSNLIKEIDLINDKRRLNHLIKMMTEIKPKKNVSSNYNLEHPIFNQIENQI